MTTLMGWCLDNQHESCRHTAKINGVAGSTDKTLVCGCECHE